MLFILFFFFLIKTINKRGFGYNLINKNIQLILCSRILTCQQMRPTCIGIYVLVFCQTAQSLGFLQEQEKYNGLSGSYKRNKNNVLIAVSYGTQSFFFISITCSVHLPIDYGPLNSIFCQFCSSLCLPRYNFFSRNCYILTERKDC